jgi:hypothetical protein
MGCFLAFRRRRLSPSSSGTLRHEFLLALIQDSQRLIVENNVIREEIIRILHWPSVKA